MIALRLPSRIIGAHAQHRSRFHTARGSLMPLSAWAELPVLLVRRLFGPRQPTPWMVSGAVSFLDGVLGADTRLLEIGSGDSTKWYAARAGHVISLEDDPGWHGQVAGELTARGATNAEVRHVAGAEMLDHIRSFDADALDVVVVDSNDSAVLDRNDCVAAARDRVRPGGYLVLDDSDFAQRRPVDDILAGWPVRRFRGMKPYPLVATETSVYQRPPAPG